MWPVGLAGLGFALGGFTWLAQTIERHHADRFGRGTSPSAQRMRRLRLQGWGALGLALAACVAAQGWVFGILYWAGLLTVSAFAVVGAFAWAPRATSRIAAASIGIGVFASAVFMQW
ncbi:Protein of unknown function [Cupriavidus sp. YR651]|nr:Protein of unknown function [Cupriavidus sp. YR651]